jgi:hypothetical protein
MTSRDLRRRAAGRLWSVIVLTAIAALIIGGLYLTTPRSGSEQRRAEAEANDRVEDAAAAQSPAVQD